MDNIKGINFYYEENQGSFGQIVGKLYCKESYINKKDRMNFIKGNWYNIELIGNRSEGEFYWRPMVVEDDGGCHYYEYMFEDDDSYPMYGNIYVFTKYFDIYNIQDLRKEKIKKLLKEGN